MMYKEHITFRKNWNNKLNNNCFTTIRRPNDKYIPGNNYSVYLQNRRLGTAELVEVRRFKLKDLSDTAARLDTGYPRDDAFNILKSMHRSYINKEGFNAPFYFLTFQFITQQKDIFE